MTNTDDQIATTTYSDGTTDVLSDWYQVASYSYLAGTSLVGTLTLAGGTTVVNRYYGLNGDASGPDDTGSGVTSEYYGDLESTTATRASDSVVLYSATYTYYDASSVHEGMIHTMSVTELQADETTISYGATYAYDSYNQLTTVSYSGDWSAGNEAYSFDALGNNTADSPNIMNQPTSANGHALTYDVQGNLTSGPNGETYKYNPLGQLVEVDGTNPDSSSYKVVYTYDWAGRMDTRTQWSGGTLQSKTEYVYDGDELIAEYDGLTGRISKSYVWDPTAQNGVGGLLAETVYTYDGDGNQTATRYSVLQNAHGDVTALINQADGTVAATYEYSAFGQLVGGDGDQSLCNFGYDGYYRDNSTGMWIAGQGERLELPGIGFVQPDPAQADLNSYRPWGNEGPNATDPTGMADGPAQETTLADRLQSWFKDFDNQGWKPEPTAALKLAISIVFLQQAQAYSKGQLDIATARAQMVNGGLQVLQDPFSRAMQDVWQANYNATSAQLAELIAKYDSTYSDVVLPVYQFPWGSEGNWPRIGGEKGYESASNYLNYIPYPQPKGYNGINNVDAMEDPTVILLTLPESIFKAVMGTTIKESLATEGSERLATILAGGVPGTYRASMGEYEFVPVTDDVVPALTQPNDYFCVPTVLDQFGVASEQIDFLKLVATAGRGVTVDAIVNAGAASEGMVISGAKIAQLEEFAASQQKMLLQVTNGDGGAHALGIHGFDDGNFLIHDPYFPRMYWQSSEELSKRLMAEGSAILIQQ